MPTYVYEVVRDDGEAGQLFEVEQKMSDPPLTKHPISGLPVRRVIQAPNVCTRYTDSHGKKTLSDKNLAAKGFTKYENVGEGKFRKTTGEGPDTIQR